MARTGRVAAGLTLLLAPALGPLRLAEAQERAALRGAVVSAESGERLAYALVILEPLNLSRFTEADGAFVIADLEVGSYRLVVRQVGYRPFDSTVTLGAATPALRIALERVAVQLAAVHVTARVACRAPGPPDPAAQPELSAIFDQLRFNAQRYAVLLAQYPFRFTIERVLGDSFVAGPPRTSRDTILLRSDNRWDYRPGRVVSDDPYKPGDVVFHPPELPDLADPRFHATHCFSFGGLDTLAGETWIRVDFSAADALRYPDVEGSAYLDTASYQVRHILLDMTRAARSARNVRAFSTRATFREILPNLILVERIEALTNFQQRYPEPNPLLWHFDRQRTLNVEFLRNRVGPPGRVP